MRFLGSIAIEQKTLLRVQLQDNRGSLNQDNLSFQFWNAIAVKITQVILQPFKTNHHKLNIGLAIDDTRNIKDKLFKLGSGIYNNSLESTLATGNKLTFENNAGYTNTLGKHFHTLEYKVIYSNYSDQKLNVAGGYGQL